jgi:S-adenosylmethionine hydrolase
MQRATRWYNTCVMNKPIFLHVITDYGISDPAFGEVVQRLHANSSDLSPTIYPTSVDFSDTVAGGFWIYQYGMGKQDTQRMVIYSNVAPRKVQRAAMKNNSGEGLKYGKLTNGVEIVAVNSEYIFSFVKPYLQEFKEIDVSNQGTQFRSRDNYPKIVNEILHGDYKSLTENLPLSLIPDVPTNRIAWIDGYGNIKTTIRRSQVTLQAGEQVKIEINGVIWTGYMSEGTFGVHHGQLAFSPGSSGYEDPFMEIFLRRHIVRDVSARDVFNFPKCGDEIKITIEE